MLKEESTCALLFNVSIISIQKSRKKCTKTNQIVKNN